MAVAISRKAPDYFQGKRDTRFAPTWDMLNQYHDDKDEELYTRKYLKILSQYSAQDVADQFPDGTIFLCYEAPNDFCHRHIFADWLRAYADVEIDEWIPEEIRKQQALINDIFGVK